MKLSKSLLFSLTFASLMGLQGVEAKSLPFTNGSGVVKDVYSGLKFHYLDKEDRLLIVNDFLQSVELEYALLPIKAKRIGLDFEKLKAEAREAEANLATIEATAAERAQQDARERISFQQAKSNMEFLDRMQLLVAKFQDTHFSIEEKVSRPLTYTGVRFYRIDGKIVIGSVEKKLLALATKLSGNDMSGLLVGDELLEINGRPVEERINELKKYIGASSDEYADYGAVRALTIRNFAYDSKNFMIVKLKNGGTQKLPIMANIPAGSTPRLDANTYFAKVGIPTDTTSIGLVFDKATKQWNESNFSFEGYSVTKMHLNLKGTTEWLDDGGSPGLRTGYYMLKGKTYGVMQLLTFATKNLKNGDNVLPYLDAIRQFVAELKENQLPLIFDLRLNGGGNGNFPAQVMSILTPENTVYGGPTTGYRITQQIRDIQEPEMFQPMAAEDQSVGITLDQLRDIFNSTIEQRRVLTPMFSYNSISTDAKINGFNNKIVALVTANCISACDMMSFLLKSSKRATIIGTHSNGTGAGFWSSSEVKTEWSDRLRVLDSRIPNFLFGVPGANPEQLVFDNNSADQLCSENRPTMADVQYAPTMYDLAKNSSGWLIKAASVLESK